MAKTLARAWTPPAALSDGCIPMHLSELADAWTKDWLVEARSVSVRSDLSFCARRNSEGDRCWSAGGLALMAGHPQLSRLALALVGYAATPARPADEPILEAIAVSSLEDLHRRFLHLFGITIPSEPVRETGLADAARFVFGYGPGLSFELLATRAALTQMRKLLAKPLRPPSALGRLSEAIGKQPIQLGVAIGDAKLGLNDLRMLSVGDIVILDRAIDDDLYITFHENTASDLRCRIERDGQRALLRLTQVG